MFFFLVVKQAPRPFQPGFAAVQQNTPYKFIVAHRQTWEATPMTPRFSSPRFFNPLMLWTDVALKTNEMLMFAGSVIQMRTQRMAQAGLAPTPADIDELQLMGHEKLEAATESGAAIANQLHTTNYALVNRAVQQWLGGANALVGLATSTSPAQAMSHGDRFVNAAARSVATATQLSSAAARIAQRGLRPIHSRTTSNARRLSRSAAWRALSAYQPPASAA
jgi:hypothetical protein